MTQSEKGHRVELCLQELGSIQEEMREHKGIMDEMFERERAVIDCMASQAEALRVKVVEAEAKLREDHPEIFEEQAFLQKEYAKAVSDVKSACYDLEKESLGKSQVFLGGNFQVKVSRATLKREYDPKILQDCPVLLEASLDGDPVRSVTVNTAVLDRLIAREEFPEDVARQYVTVTVLRNPQTRITELPKEDEGDAQ